MNQILEQAKDFWTVSSRFNRRKDSPMMRQVAVKDMMKMRQETNSPGVLRRINLFIVSHHRDPTPFSTGPKRA